MDSFYISKGSDRPLGDETESPASTKVIVKGRECSGVIRASRDRRSVKLGVYTLENLIALFETVRGTLLSSTKLLSVEVKCGVRF